MDKQEALEIICMISEGLNPYLNKDPVKNPPELNPATIRAICTAISHLLSSKDQDELKDLYHRRGISEIIDSVSGPLKEHLKKSEKNLIRQVLDEVDNDEEMTSKALNLTRFELKKKLIEYGLFDAIFAKHYLNDIIESNQPLDDKLADIETQIMAEALDKCDQDKMQAAKLLGITFRSFRYKIEKNKQRLDGKYDANLLELLETKSFKELLQLIEYECLVRTLEVNNGKNREAAEFLGITFRSLRYRLERHGIS